MLVVTAIIRNCYVARSYQWNRVDITGHTTAYVHVDFCCDTLYPSICLLCTCKLLYKLSVAFALLQCCTLLRRYSFGELVRLRPNECSLFIAALVRYCFVLHVFCIRHSYYFLTTRVCARVVLHMVSNMYENC